MRRLFVVIMSVLSWRCVSDVRAETRLFDFAGVGDTLHVTIFYRTSGAPDSVRWVVSVGSAADSVTRPGSASKAGPLWLVPVPALAEGDSVEVMATWRAWKRGQVFPGVTVRQWYRKPIAPPGVVVDSLQVIGIIAVPESGWTRTVVTRVRNTWSAICAGQTSPAVCLEDLEMARCERYRNGQAGGSPLGSAMDQALGVTRLAMPVVWRDSQGKTVVLGGLGHDWDGVPVPECAGYLPPVCLVADLVDGRRALTKESWARLACRRQLYQAMVGPSGPWRWALPDSTVSVQTPRRLAAEALAYRASYVNEPIGIGVPGTVGYAALKTGTVAPYIIGLCPCRDTVRVGVGEAVALRIKVRLSDGGTGVLEDEGHVYRALEPGVHGFAARTPWGVYSVTVLAGEHHAKVFARGT